VYYPGDVALQNFSLTGETSSTSSTQLHIAPTPIPNNNNNNNKGNESDEEQKSSMRVCQPGILVLDSLHGSAARVVTLLKRFVFILFVFFFSQSQSHPPLRLLSPLTLSDVRRVYDAVICDKSGKQRRVVSTMQTNSNIIVHCLLLKLITATVECFFFTMQNCFVLRLLRLKWSLSLFSVPQSS
jgi:hypothetical protein